jgi:hypothetical protein
VVFNPKEEHMFEFTLRIQPTPYGWRLAGPDANRVCYLQNGQAGVVQLANSGEPLWSRSRSRYVSPTRRWPWRLPRSPDQARDRSRPTGPQLLPVFAVFHKRHLRPTEPARARKKGPNG